MLTESHVPRYLWNEAVLSATYLLNRSPTSALKDQVTPVELWTNQKPNISKLRVFGSKAFAWIPSQLRKKLDSKSRMAIMIGYAPSGYRLWDIERRQLFIARDVKFNENCFPFAEIQDVQSAVPLVFVPYDLEVNSEANENRVLQCIEQEGEDQTGDVEPVQENETPLEIESSITPALPSHLEHGSNHDEESVRRSERERRPPGKWKNYLVGRIFTAVQYSSDNNLLPDPPETFRDVSGRPDEEQWMKAIQEELMSLRTNNVWKFVKCPSNVTPLKSKWIFRVKEDANGNPVRYKARLVAKGFLQQAGIDYGETYAPVAELATIRTVLAVAVYRKMHIHQLDVKTAFLYGDLKEDVYLAVPDGVLANSNVVCKLEKSLYGFKQSPRCWNEKLNEILIKNGFTRSRHDYCLYTRSTSNR